MDATIPYADGGSASTMSGGYLLCVPTGSKNQDLAWEFIEYAAGAESQFGYTAARGYVPTFTSLMERASDYYEIDPYFSVILEQLNNAHFRPSIPQYTEIAAEVFQGTYDDVVYWIKNGIVDLGFLSVSSAKDIPRIALTKPYAKETI